MPPFDPIMDRFLELLEPDARQTFLKLDSPEAVQAFLDELPYSAEDANRCPKRVLKDRVAHCLDGALLAAAAFRRLGIPPTVIDLLPEPGTDDDHVIVLFQRAGCYGAVAKSNYTGLRYREAVYRSYRELVMSYFEVFFNIHGQKTLRSYTRPLDLRLLDGSRWLWEDSGADQVESRLFKLRRVALISPEAAGHLSLVDQRSYQAGMLGVNQAGLYQPGKSKKIG
jgi:hypothetical protein